ncbi:MAG: DUF1566 domain-containing protein [Methylococcales bacterium]
MKAKVLALLMLASQGVYAADCTNAGIQPSSDETIDFEIAADGTVTDKSSGLMWMRCSVGQSWVQSAGTCAGSVIKAEWDKMVLLNQFNASGGFAGKTDWRLPNINELRSLTEDCRSDPAINTLLFPDTPSTKYWTSSPYVGLVTSAWVVDFSHGRDNFELKNNTNAVRLVRVAD